MIVGRTEAEAKAKFEDYRSHISHAGALTLFSGWTGIDFSHYSLDDPIRYLKNDAINSAVEAFTLADPNRTWTVREIAEFVGIGGMGPILVGSPEQIADELESWIETTDIDGFNLCYAVTPESFADFVDLVVPELQRRGVYKREYREGTLREKLYGPGRARLPESHPANAYRHHVAGAAERRRQSASTIAASGRVKTRRGYRERIAVVVPACTPQRRCSSVPDAWSLAQCSHPHAARPGALEIPRRRQLLPEQGQAATACVDLRAQEANASSHPLSEHS